MFSFDGISAPQSLPMDCGCPISIDPYTTPPNNVVIEVGALRALRALKVAERESLITPAEYASTKQHILRAFTALAHADLPRRESPATTDKTKTNEDQHVDKIKTPTEQQHTDKMKTTISNLNYDKARATTNNPDENRTKTTTVVVKATAAAAATTTTNRFGALAEVEDPNALHNAPARSRETRLLNDRTPTEEHTFQQNSPSRKPPKEDFDKIIADFRKEMRAEIGANTAAPTKQALDEILLDTKWEIKSEIYEFIEETVIEPMHKNNRAHAGLGQRVQLLEQKVATVGDKTFPRRAPIAHHNMAEDDSTGEDDNDSLDGNSDNDSDLYRAIFNTQDEDDRPMKQKPAPTKRNRRRKKGKGKGCG
jgi:hypothetical protein